MYSILLKFTYIGMSSSNKRIIECILLYKYWYKCIKIIIIKSYYYKQLLPITYFYSTHLLEIFKNIGLTNIPITL